jgi:hypothetical protein
VTVHIPEPDSRLDQLASRYTHAKAEYDAAAVRFAEIKDGIKAELSAAYPGESKVRLRSDYLEGDLLLSSRESWRIDAARMKAESPETYVEFAKKSVSWELRQV